MFKNLIFAVTLLLAVPGPSVGAHPSGHGGAPIVEGQALSIATQVAKVLVKNDAGLGFGTLAPSWENLPKDAAMMHRKDEDYYVVSIRNAEEGRTLYVLMSAAGEVYDANFTGRFEGVN